MDKDIECLIVADEERQAVLATTKTYRLNGLYYIPVKAYCAMTGDKACQAEAETLLHLFAYLHQQAGVPFYQESGSFMDYQYDTLDNWLQDMEEEDPEEKEWNEERRGVIYELRQAGAKLMPLLQDPQRLQDFAAVIARNGTKIDGRLGGIAASFLALYRQYPDRNIFDNLHTDLLYPGEEETITPDQYTGFYWSPYDCFATELDEMLNSSFQEIAVTAEPVSVTCFDRLPPAQQLPPVDFETRLYGLIDELRDYLIDREDEERNRTI